MRQIGTEWFLNLLTNEQGKARVQFTELLLKQYPNNNARYFANVPVDNTLVNFYEPKTKTQKQDIGYKVAKDHKLQIKRNISFKKIMCITHSHISVAVMKANM
jgi:hypothetical protein